MSLDQKKILVVEDEFLLARELTRALEDAGATVIGPVPSVDRAMFRVRHEPIDAAVLDIHVRGEDVLRVADALRERTVPIVFATGYEDHQVRRCHAEAPCIAKPVNLQKLVEVLGKAITGA